jgi:hypothetical protein
MESTFLSSVKSNSLLLAKLKTHSLSLDEFMERVHEKIKGDQTQMIFGTLKFMLSSSSMISSQNIKKLLTLLKNHRFLETQRLIAIKGELFKVRIFQTILPIIFALLTSIFLQISSIIPNTFFFFSLSFTVRDLTLFFLNQLMSINITIFFFRKTVGLKNSIISVLGFTLFFLIIFILSFLLLQTISISV